MARLNLIKALRTSRDSLNYEASVNNLNSSELYFITDENRIATGTGTNTYQELAKSSRGTWAPSVVASSGSITAYTASGSWQRFDDVVLFDVEVYISNNGTGAVSLIFSVPFSYSGPASGSGREGGVTGKMLQAFRANSDQIQVQVYDNSYPGGSGYLLNIGGKFRV
jgi:hypothetical protein